MKKTFPKVEQALADLRAGKMVILFDHKDRENEGDLVIAAEKITPEIINFMSIHARGLICLSMEAKDLDRLQIPLMQPITNPRKSAFTVSIEAAVGVTTGISAADRARTVQVAIDPNSNPSDIVSPGHIFPLRARKGGVLERRGHTEGSVDLAKLAGLHPSAVICEIVKEDGTMARFSDLEELAKKFQLNMLTIKDVIDYRTHHESLIEEVAETRLPIQDYGDFKLKIFTTLLDKQHHIALIKEPIKHPTLVRMHSECFTGDLFGSSRCDCGWQLQTALKEIGENGGVLLYLPQEGRGIGLVNKLKAYALQDKGLDTVEANIELGFGQDQRDYWVGAQILNYLQISKIELLTNNPQKISDLENFGIEVTQRKPLIAEPNNENKFYLETKQRKLGHLFDFIKKVI